MLVRAVLVEQERVIIHIVILRLGLVEHHITKVRNGIEQGGLATGIAAIHDAELQKFNTFGHLVNVLPAHRVIVSRHEAEGLPLPDAVEILYLKFLYHLSKEYM